MTDSQPLRPVAQFDNITVVKANKDHIAALVGQGTDQPNLISIKATGLTNKGDPAQFDLEGLGYTKDSYGLFAILIDNLPVGIAVYDIGLDSLLDLLTVEHCFHEHPQKDDLHFGYMLLAIALRATVISYFPDFADGHALYDRRGKKLKASLDNLERAAYGYFHVPSDASGDILTQLSKKPYLFLDVSSISQERLDFFRLVEGSIVHHGQTVLMRTLHRVMNTLHATAAQYVILPELRQAYAFQAERANYILAPRLTHVQTALNINKSYEVDLPSLASVGNDILAKQAWKLSLPTLFSLDGELAHSENAIVYAPFLRRFQPQAIHEPTKDVGIKPFTLLKFP